jgi:hypothetical protein
MKKCTMSCLECNADFKILHSMDEEVYIPKNCVFCGAEIWNEDDDLNLDEEEGYLNEY